MITLFHLKNAVKKLKVSDFTKRDLSTILLDLFNADTERMGARVKITILNKNEQEHNDPEALKTKPMLLDNYTRTLYIHHRHTTVCEYKQRRTKNDKTKKYK